MAPVGETGVWMKLAEIAEKLQCELVGDGAVEIARVRGIEFKRGFNQKRHADEFLQLVIANAEAAAV